MSLSSAISDLASRIATEFKSVKAVTDALATSVSSKVSARYYGPGSGAGASAVFSNVLNVKGGVAAGTSSFVFDTPFEVSSNRMVRIHFKGYNYTTGTSHVDFEVSFYSSSSPFNAAYINNGNFPVDVKIYVKNSTNTYSIGVTAPIPWQYIQFVIEKVYVSYGSGGAIPDSYGDTWPFGFFADPTANGYTLGATATKYGHTHDGADLTTGKIADARFPARIGAGAAAATDWNAATTPGWYVGSNTAANAPVADWCLGLVQNANSGSYVTQTVFQYGATTAADTKAWRRTSINGVWQAWYRIRMSETELSALYAAKVHTHGVTDLTATGTPSNVTFLRGDNTWAVPDASPVDSTKISDWDLATAPGFYYGDNAAANAPATSVAGHMGVVTRTANAAYVTQTVWELNGASSDTKAWRRQRYNNAWQSWYRIRLSQTEMEALFAAKVHTHTKADVGLSAVPNVDATNASNLSSGTIVDPRFPLRLREQGSLVVDWNIATQDGWYCGNNADNGPGSSYYAGMVTTGYSGDLVQTVQRITASAGNTEEVYRRRRESGNWTAWYRVLGAEDDLDARYAQVGHKARLSQSIDRTIANTTSTYINFDSEAYDIGGLGDVTNNRFVIQRSGYYHVLFWAQWQANGNGRRAITVDVVGGDTITNVFWPAGNQVGHEVSTENYWTAGTVIRFPVYQSSGGNLLMTASRATIHELP